ncbi:MAG TPA: type II toxin-antitoxin system VapC family toxin [Allosphingosinicella sp.]|jgi:PIN domain nuclease of toxin-antitoxin system
MDLILDTHTLLWLVTGDRRLSQALVAQLADPDTRCFVSGVTAWEYSDLHCRGRLPGSVPLPLAQERFGFAILDFPADLWTHAAALPDIHGDPVDRMLIAHAIAANLVLVTADREIARYPVRTLW